MQQAVKEVAENDFDKFQQMKSIAHAYASKRECSVQEAVYHIMPELWLRKIFPGVIYANSNLPEKRMRMVISEKEIAELPDDSTDIYKRNMIDRYIDRPALEIIEQLCYAEILKRYQLVPKVDENDCQPEELVDEIVEVNHTSVGQYPKVITTRLKEKLKCRRVERVLRYHVPNRHKEPEAYAHHLLFMFYPFRIESALKSGDPLSYHAKLNEPGVLDTINRNKILTEPFSDLVDEAYARFRADLSTNLDSFAQQENDEIDQELLETLGDNNGEDDVEDDNQPMCVETVTRNVTNISILNDNEINAKIRSLNFKQRQIFDIIHGWAKDFMKNLSSKAPKTILPFNLFLTGSGGCGKSHLIKTIYHSITKLLLFHGGNPDKIRVLVLAPTGVAAINIDGTTIHSGLNIPCRGKLFPLNDKNRALLRNKYSEVQVIIIDEISMVPSKLLFHIHQRLLEIFGCLSNAPFAGKSVLVCGDLYQLPPVRAKPIFMFDGFSTLFQGVLSMDLWRNFKIAELTEVMRQKDDLVFINLLNKVRVGNIDNDVESLLKTRFISKSDPSYPNEALHIFAENSPAKVHNETMLKNLGSPLISIHAEDVIPKNCRNADVIQARNRSQSESGGLAFLLELKVDARVMITSNIDISDRLINGQLGVVKHLKLKHDKVTTIYLKLDDDKAGLKEISGFDTLARRNNWVPIKKQETLIYIKSSKSTSSPSIRRTQFPLMLSWACTVHKVQGLSLSKGVVSFDLEKQSHSIKGRCMLLLVESPTSVTSF